MKNTYFNDIWKLEKGQMSSDEFSNKRLSLDELNKVRKTIETLQEKGLPSGKIIEALQKMNAKLIEKWRAERVYWTENKRKDSEIISEAGKDLEIKTFKTILSPNACETCISKCDNGKKIFKSSDLSKSGYGHIPPFHPNCYCILIPE